MRVLSIVVAIASGVVVLAAAALADCSSLKLVTSVNLESDANGRIHYVPVEIGGKSAKMLLDTGAAATLIWRRAANQLSLVTRPSHFIVIDANGRGSDEETITSLKLGLMTSNSVHIAIAPAALDDMTKSAGVLGADILVNYDVSIDFGTGKMDILSPDHCEGKVVYWPERPIAIVPFDILDDHQILFVVKLDGQRIRAMLDTGATNTTLIRSSAEGDFEVKLGSADTPIAGNLNGVAGFTTWSHQFMTLEFDGVTVSNPKVLIIPNLKHKHYEDWNERFDPDMIVGMNVLKGLHVYIAYKERKLYITPAGTPTPPSPAQ
jgi:predicted aspartyl protease